MTACGDNVQATRSPRRGVQRDIRTTARHVGGNGNAAQFTGLRDDFGFGFVLTGV
tara:strand:- start:39662 stop:39826 length:165 start_codon:yes stop_codon:yes gene_type:complete